MERIEGWLRSDGRKGIRNTLQVVYLVECAHHVARQIATSAGRSDVQLIGFGGCYPNEYAHHILGRLCTHPNVGAVLLVSLGCEGFDRVALMRQIRETGRPVDLVSIQGAGGTRKAIAEGNAWVNATLPKLDLMPRASMSVSELVVGTICGGSDASSGISANPAVGHCFDKLVQAGAACVFEETGELIGCEEIMAARATSPELGQDLRDAVEKAARFYAVLGHGSFAPGNADGGLTTQEEKSMGAYAKSGSSRISGILKPGEIARRGGLYLLDIVPEGEVRFGFPNINDVAEVIELISCGAHIVLFTTGRGSVVGSAISPVIKICANPETFRRMSEDMDVDAGRILEGNGTIAEVGNEILQCVERVARGQKSRSEEMGHQEFALTYKSLEPVGPGCFPS